MERARPGPAGPADPRDRRHRGRLGVRSRRRWRPSSARSPTTGADGANRASPMTTAARPIEEQSEDAAALLEATADEPAVVCGAGPRSGDRSRPAAPAKRARLGGGADRADAPAAHPGRHRGALPGPPPDRDRRRQPRERDRRLPLRRAAGAWAGRERGFREATAAAARDAAARAWSAELGIPAGWRMPLPAAGERGAPVGDRHLRVDAAAAPGRRRIARGASRREHTRGR